MLTRISTLLTSIMLLVACDRAPSSGLLGGEIPESLKLKVMSYNTYLLEADPNGQVSLAKRRELMPAAIAATGADIVIMQEVWGSSRASLAAKMAEVGYIGKAKEIPSFWPPYNYGNGLYIFIKAPLTFVGEPKLVIYPYSSMLNFDKFTNKGAIVITVDVPDYGAVDVFAAHSSYLHFDGETSSFDMASEPKLLTQIKTVTDFIATSNAKLKILGADFNTHPTRWNPADKAFDAVEKSNVYKALTETAGLTDASGTAVDNFCLPDCITWDNENSLIKQGIFTDAAAEPNERIDYVMFKGEGVSAKTAQLAMTEEHEFTFTDSDGVSSTKMLPLADHFGVLVELELPAN